MRKILTASIFILSFCFFAFGQNTNCPEISVTGPSSVLQPGETATFILSVTGEIEEAKLEYLWSVSDGKIIEGQGTRAIIVGEVPWDSTPTATVDIKGLPEGCPNTDTETGVICSCISPILVDELEISSKPINLKRLNTFVSEIKSNPDDAAYIIIYSNKRFSLSEIKRKESFIKNYLVSRQIEENRIKIIIARNNGNNDENRIRFWRVPQGAQPPTP